jgi:tetratricopeptide (TPR) repeat protein
VKEVAPNWFLAANFANFSTNLNLKGTEMDNHNLFQLLLDRVKALISAGLKHEQKQEMANARIQYEAALAELKTFAADTTMVRSDEEKICDMCQHVHGILASICERSSEYQQAANHWEEQLALSTKLYGDRCIILLGIHVSLSHTYFKLRKEDEGKAAAARAYEVIRGRLPPSPL